MIKLSKIIIRKSSSTSEVPKMQTIENGICKGKIKENGTEKEATGVYYEQDKNTTHKMRRELIGQSLSLYFSSDPVKIVRASGQYMYDEQGTEYLDCVNNVAHVGHCHPHVVNAACNQMARLNTNTRFLHDAIVCLAQRLTDTLPPGLDVCYFVNSGSEANDLAIRLMQAHTGRKHILTTDHGYHGNLSSLIDISPYKFNQPGGVGQQPHVHVVPYPDTYRGEYTTIDHTSEQCCELYLDCVTKKLEECERSGTPIGAFFCESIQGCGGQVVPPEGYLKNVYKTVKAAGALVVADEVQVGFGRVGSHWWGFQLQGNDVCPDIVTLGKPMGNGHPVAAVITTADIASSFTATGVEYFNTFGGSPVSSVTALAVMDVLEKEGLMQNALETGTYLLNRFKSLQENHDIIGDVRGAGLFIGVDLVTNRASRKPATHKTRLVLQRLKEKRILLSCDGPYNNVLKLKPPMCFNKENADTLIKALDEIFSDV